MKPNIKKLNFFIFFISIIYINTDLNTYIDSSTYIDLSTCFVKTNTFC